MLHKKRSKTSVQSMTTTLSKNVLALDCSSSWGNFNTMGKLEKGNGETLKVQSPNSKLTSLNKNNISD